MSRARAETFATTVTLPAGIRATTTKRRLRLTATNPHLLLTLLRQHTEMVERYLAETKEDTTPDDQSL